MTLDVESLAREAVDPDCGELNLYRFAALVLEEAAKAADEAGCTQDGWAPSDCVEAASAIRAMKPTSDAPRIRR